MKLIVKNQQGENFDLDILPGDTFYDVQNRLFNKKKMVLDMAKLAAPNRPFSLSANVVEYFSYESNLGLNIDHKKLSKSEDLQNKTQDNTSLNTDLQDIYLDEDCNKDNNLDDFQIKDADELSVIESNSIDQWAEEDELLRKYQPNLEDINFSADFLTELMPLCRLCAQEIYDNNLTYIYEVTPEDGTTWADKINACLPVTVSLTDKLPKQICSDCLINLESSYIFASCVSSAEDRLRSLQLSSNIENMNCPLCCEGCMETVPVELDVEKSSSDTSSPLPLTTVKLEKVEHEELEFMTNKETSKVNDCQNYSTTVTHGHEAIRRKRRKKSDSFMDYDEGDKDWCVEDEREPARKKGPQRGRPKGSKNKFSKPKNMDCFICHSKFKDFNDALTHTLSAHCDSINETFPCPLCQRIVTSEQELSDHIDTHNDKKELQIIIISCSLCEMQFKQASEIYKHVLEKHSKRVEAYYTCLLCDCALPDVEQLVTHVMQNHLVKDRILSCPICSLGYDCEEEMKHHFIDNHIDQPENAVCCSECRLKMDSETTYLNHIVDQHCTTAVYKVPSYYSCSTCTNNFRSQYHLIKHTCSVVFEDLLCRECDKVFPTKARFVFHLNTHQFNFSVMRCDQCLALFSDEDTFYDHVRFQHEPDDQLECEECHKVFKNAMSLSMHMRRHQPNRDHECVECGKRFQNAQTLREHRVSHMSVKPYQCHICGAYLSRLSRLRIHLRSHSVKACKASMKVYKCCSCFQLFPNNKVAVKHSDSHTNEENINLEEIEVSLVFRCEYCDACFQKTSELNAHRRETHPDPDAYNAYTCSVCGAQFSTYARVTTHKLTHGINTESLIVPDEVGKGEETFVIPQFFLCHECDKRCLHYTYMNLHRRFQHSSGKPVFTCSICKEKFATSWSLQFHKKKQHNSGEGKPIEGKGEGRILNTLYHCKVCDKPYVTENSLEMHTRRCHQTDNQEDSSSNFICETCGKTFQYKTALEAHADAHKGLKRFECNSCDRRFTHRAGLIRHMKLHSDDDPFICEFCGKKFRDRTERENHRRAHTGERPFMCDVCGRTFHTRAVWLDHSRIHQDIRPYQCDICNQTFRRSYALKSHYLIHTGERPFSCEICGKTFRLKQTLFAHKKKEHQNNEPADQNILPDEVLLIEEDSQYGEDNYNEGILPTMDESIADCDNLVAKTYESGGTIRNPENMNDLATSVITSENIIDQSGSWNTSTKTILNRTPVLTSRTLLKENVGSIQPETQPYF